MGQSVKVRHLLAVLYFLSQYVLFPYNTNPLYTLPLCDTGRIYNGFPFYLWLL